MKKAGSDPGLFICNGGCEGRLSTYRRWQTISEHDIDTVGESLDGHFSG
jgi:hypothetical protein